jgi:hypothetical protein
VLPVSAQQPIAARRRLELAGEFVRTERRLRQLAPELVFTRRAEQRKLDRLSRELQRPRHRVTRTLR